jgi:hypothetical protein
MSLSSKVNYSLEALSGITVGNINITGSIFQNNNPYIASQWTSTTGNTITYTSGNVNISNLSTTNISASTLLAPNGITVGNINFTGILYQNGSPYIGSQWTSTSGNLITYTSGNVVVSNTISAGNVVSTGITTSTLLAGTNVTTASLQALNASIGNLSMGNLQISGNVTIGGNVLIAGTLVSVNITSVNLIESNITTASIVGADASFGNLQVTNWTTENFLFTNSTLTNTVLTNFTANNIITNSVNYGMSSTFSGSFLAANNVISAAPVTGLVFNSSNVTFFTATLTATLLTSTPSTLFATFTLRGTFNGTWGIISSYLGDNTGITFDIDSSTGQLTYTSTDTTDWTSNTFRYRVDQFSASGTYSSVLGSTISNYILDTVQISNTSDAISGINVGGLEVIGGATIRKALLTGNNTNIVTSTGNVGFNTTAPNTAYNVDINGSLRGLRVDIGGAQPVYNNNTLGRLFITGTSNSVVDGPNILITTSQDSFPTYNLLTYGHDSAWTMYDMYFDGTSFRNSSSATAFMMVKENSTLKWNYNTSGFSAGAAAPVSTSICIGSGGNVGLGGQVIPAYTLDISGSSRITGGLTVGNINFTGSLSQNGAPYIGSQWTGTTGTLYYGTAGSSLVGINTTAPQFTLDVSGGARITTGVTAGASTFTSVSAGNSQFTGLSAGNINFTGNLFQNGSPYIGSQWLGTSGNISFGTAGSSLVGINTTAPMFTLDVSGGARITTGITAGASTFTGLSSANIYASLGTITSLVATASTITNLNVPGTLTVVNITSTNLLETNITSSSILVNNNLNIAGIASFYAGSFSANNNVTSSTSVTGLLFPTSTIRSFVATLTINLNKAGGNLNSMVTIEGIQRDSGWVIFDSTLGESSGLVFTIDSTGQILYTSLNYAGWVSTTIRFEGRSYSISGTYTPPTLATSGNITLPGQLAVRDASDVVSTSSGALTVSGGVGISKSLLVGGNVNVGGLSNTFTGSFAAANNVSGTTDVTGFIVPTATFSSFTASVNVRQLTTTSTFNSQYLFEATQSTGGWLLNDTSFGDNVGLTFTITSAGQIQYTSTNVATWQSTTINFAVTAISISSGFTAVLPTSGNVTISGNLQIDNTTDSSSTSSASLVLAGGMGINKSLLLGGNFNIGGVSTQFAGTFTAANGASASNVTGLLFPNATIRSFTCTISVRVVSSINYNTQHTIEGVQTATGGWQINDYQLGDASGITFNINSSGQITYTSPTFTSWTSTTMHYNATVYNISSTYTPIPMPTGGNMSIAGPVVIQSTAVSSSASSGALTVSGGVGIQSNLIVANSFFVTSSGNVGIGASSPNYTLDINGSFDVSNTNGYMIFGTSGNVAIGTTTLSERLNIGTLSTASNFGASLVLDSSTGANGRRFYLGSTLSGNAVGAGSFNIYDLTANASRFVISSTGNVGIGTNTPTFTLDVSGTFDVSNANGLMLFASSGNVGIGTTSPIATLDFGAGSTSKRIGLAVQTSNFWGFGAANSAIEYQVPANSEHRFYTGSTTTALGTERMRISTSGNVGIGTASPQASLHVAGFTPTVPTGTGVFMGIDTLANSQIQLNSTSASHIDFSTSGTDWLSRIIYYNTSGSLSGSLNFHVASSTSIGMSLTSAGTLLISGDIGAFASISDRSLKTNVTDISPQTALDTVKTLRPVTFNWKDDIFNAARRGEFDSGFIAQEVEEVIPHAVGQYTTVDHQNTYKNMRHERIIPYLVGSIQKLEETITQLKGRIEYLESK